MADNKKYDVGIYGLWYGNNYGSIITYFALSKIMEKMGKTYAMLRNPLGVEINIDGLRRSHPLKFGFSHYEITPACPLDRMYEHNDRFDAFLLGSDQMWNYYLSKPYKQSYFFDFAADDKVKVAYATSFGKEKYVGPPKEKAITQVNLKRFDGISVRDDFSKRICEEEFGVPAELVFDPVFLCDRKNYENLILEAENRLNEKYIFAYILDPNPEVGRALKNAAAKSGLNVYVVFNESSDKQKCKESLGTLDDKKIRYIEEPTVQEWLWLYQNSEFVLTDSFHGTCFSVIFNRPFVVLKNNGRGGGRFTHLLGTLGLLDYMAETPQEMITKFDHFGVRHKIDYKKVYKRINPLIKHSYDWLEKSLSIKKKRVTAEKPAVPAPAETNADISRCRMLASLLRDYGVTHVVTAPGQKNVPLMRFFEYNKKVFTTYNVADERSAAYYALGLASKLGKPVCVLCSSGTAPANCLPGVTEAKLSGLPLVVVSADAYPCYESQMEHRMTDNTGALASAVKASVTLPVAWDGLSQWETRRRISETLLEMNHHGTGPVHINVPMNFVSEELPKPQELALGDYRHIYRIDAESDASELDGALKRLKAASRILIVAGQDAGLSADGQKAFDSFCRRFNCAVVTDHLSNLHNEYTVKPFNLLRTANKDLFNKTLAPDLVITFGGKQTVNSPIIAKLRMMPRIPDFWRIDETGAIADTYRQLSHVFEMSPARFFGYFADRAKDGTNDKKYLEVWKAKTAEVRAPGYRDGGDFSSFYSIGGLMAALPENSQFFLGAGTSVYRAQMFSLRDSVTVSCNNGAGGADGCASAFMGRASVSEEPSFLLIGDMGFFQDMNAFWNKSLGNNIRIMMNNNGGAGFLKNFKADGATQSHVTTAMGWVQSLGFRYLCAHNREEYDILVKEFTAAESDRPIFFEVMLTTDR